MKTKICICCMVHDDSAYLAESIASFAAAGPAFVFVSRTPWHDSPGDWEAAAARAREAGAEVILGDWSGELAHRQAALQRVRERGFTHALIPDGDEIIEPGLLQTLIRLAEHDLADRVSIHMDTYWYSPEYVIRPRERLTPIMLVNLHSAHPVGGRNFEGGRSLVLPPTYGVLHHLSYVGPDERIRRKLETWGHRDEVLPNWYEEVWRRWPGDRLMRRIHPTHPDAYGFAERIHVPDLLAPALERFRALGGEPVDADRASLLTPSLALPTVSLIIPLHGGRADIEACLRSLEACRDLLSEVIVVDNASPDGAADAVDALRMAWDREGSACPLHLLRNETNLGFAAACNRGIAKADGEILLFLNSDTLVPRAGLLRLLESVTASGTVAAAGPYTNYAGHWQQMEPTYTTTETLDLFAEDFAAREQEDPEVDMLVGFCLAVRRSALREVRGFDERFGLGTFEDNDLCYRLRRKGYRLRIAARAFVHHHGSRTMLRMQEEARGLSLPTVARPNGRPAFDLAGQMRRNERLYREKWRADIESGFASHLAGLSAQPIVFQPDREPERLARRLQERARRADISLCMIVKNEERVLADCLRSAKPFFREMIVVDTGSTDRTREIARELGARLFEMAWPDSFALARNESLRHARGRWIFWMDADDTLPLASGEALLDAALEAPPDVAGFVVPVQFVEEGEGAGTRVDHVKLFRNRPGVEFEGRIHEQILPSLRRTGGRVARCPAVVLHSGYDSTPEGQARKRIRDAKLLELELQDRPNHGFVLFNLGMTDFYGGKPEGAVRWLTRCLELSPPTDSHVRKAYALLGLALQQKGDAGASLAIMEKGLTVTPGDPELHFHLGRLYTDRGDFPAARRHYEQALQDDISEHFSSVDIGILGFKTYHNLGTVCLLQEDYRSARAWWEKAIEAAPRFLPSVFALFDAALEAGDPSTARRMLEALLQTEGPGENWVTMGMRHAAALDGPAGAEAFLHQAQQRYPGLLSARLAHARLLLESGREAAARRPLAEMAQEGIAEAAFMLGVEAIRRGAYQEALGWMERAGALNPDHAETQNQIDQLRQMLGIEAARPSPAVSAEEALRQAAETLGLDFETLRRCFEGDAVGGYRAPTAAGDTPLWPGGSVWEQEGKLLYALVRAVRPETVVEIGSLVGCSTSHLALACLRNEHGTVYAVDPALDFRRVDPALKERIVPVAEDVFAWTPPAGRKIDFLFEDGSHAPGFTRDVLERLRPYLSPTALVVTHDYHHARLGAHIAAEFNAAFADSGARLGSVLIAPSDCGLGYVLLSAKASPDASGKGDC